jgi:hypothetical protein
MDISKRELHNKKQRERRLKNGNATTFKYEKTKKGFLVRCYRNMKSRISGVQKSKFHLYKGKELMDKDLFYSYSLDNDNFHSLFKEWEDSGYNRKLTPSLDRINSAIGYELSNVEWVTHSENSRRGALNRNKKK